MPFIAVTYVYASSQGQRTLSAQTNNHSSSFRHMQGGNAQTAAHSYPEMALQADGCALPIAHSLAGHVTGRTGAQPTTAQIEMCKQNSIENGHFEEATLARYNLDSWE